MPRKYKELSASDIHNVVMLRAAGLPDLKIADQLDTSKSTVRTVIKHHATHSLAEIEAVVAEWHQYKRFWSALFFEKRTAAPPGSLEYEFTSKDQAAIVERLALKGNRYDLKYNLKGRGDWPEEVQQTAPEGMEWRITTRGKGKYAFTLHIQGEGLIELAADLAPIKIMDAIPSIVERYSRKDEQALLARIRYNNLVGMFLGLSVHSLQSHWKTSIGGTGIPAEIDEMYVGVDADGRHHVIPVEAKSIGPKERLTADQILGNHRAARLQFPGVHVISVAAKVLDEYTIAMVRFEVDEDAETVRPVFERHYRLSRNPAGATPQPVLTAIEVENYGTPKPQSGS